MVSASDSGARGRGSIPTSTVLCPWAWHIQSPKVLVIPWKGWFRPEMTKNCLLGRKAITKRKRFHGETSYFAKCVACFGASFCSIFTFIMSRWCLVGLRYLHLMGKSCSFGLPYMNRNTRKPTTWILTRSDTNQAVQRLEMARVLKCCM